MPAFTQAIQQKIDEFLPYSDQYITLSGESFSQTSGFVCDFLAEIHETATILSHQTRADYSEFYAERLVRQFDLLQQAVKKNEKNTKVLPQFKSTYRFPKNLHHLPAEKRLPEYRKALRALNEKLAWLSEQVYSAEETQKALFVTQIEETEYRKLKCLQAIEMLE